MSNEKNDITKQEVTDEVSMEEDVAQKIEVSQEAIQPARSKRRKAPFIVGVALFVFAVIGFIQVLSFTVGGVRNLVSDTAKKEEYSTFLTPIIMFDPDPFDDVSQGKMEQLINATIWSLLRSDIETDRYETTGEGEMLIPQSDVALQFEKIFGNDIKVSHRTVVGIGYEFQYDASQSSYRVPITSVEPIYAPQVLDIDKQAKTIVLTVGFLASGQWIQAKDGALKDVEADKYMKITLRLRDDDTYYISAMQLTDQPEYVTTKATTTTTTEITTETTTIAPTIEETTEDVDE